MSRSGYSDDCETLGLYRASVDAALYGRRGQAFLRELVAALEAMPVKELHAGVLVDGDRVCALGAVADVRALDVSDVDIEDPKIVGRVLGIPRSLAAEIAFENDDSDGWTRGRSPEERYADMLTWARSHLREQPLSHPGRGACSWCLAELTLTWRGVLRRHRYKGAPCPGSRKPPAVHPSLRSSDTG